jgi:hypothetical protein
MSTNISTIPERDVKMPGLEQGKELPELQRGIEVRGIERVPPKARADVRMQK